ncbi:hypothetical protein RCH14_004172 [Massilia sp. MP_M2]|uniref:hypothetical protein n=1 Tax=Massilia sp. MP_M2 TaxID=3071713 RepID=UPI00319E8CA1
MNTLSTEKYNELLKSDEVIFHDYGSDNLIIWFGGINEPHFNPEIARLANCDILTVRDIMNSWYTTGLTSSHANIDQAILELKQFIADRKYKKICLCGQSSGGYGALFYSHLLNADLCIAFSPQTRNVFNGQCQMTPDIRIKDVGEFFDASSPTKILLNMSRSESDHDEQFAWNDWLQIEKLRKKPNVTVITHPYDNHSVSAKLREAGLLYRFTASLINTYLY